MIVYAIIVTYNAMRRSWIERCLRSLSESSVKVTPIVIDNGSTDETRNFVPVRFPQAVWLPQEHNIGFGQANNIGLKYALEHDADYVLLLNQDATIGRDALEKMIPLCGDNSLMSPLHLNGEGNRLDASFKTCINSLDGELLDNALIGHALQPAYPGPSLASGCVIPAACWLLPINVIKHIGGFNPLFFHYGEDGNYYQRLHFHHIAVQICPSAIMCHDRNVCGDVNMFNRNKLRRNLLITAANVNLSFLQCIRDWLRTLKDCYMVDLRQHRYRLGAWTSAMIWIATHGLAIRKSRKAEKNTGTTWL